MIAINAISHWSFLWQYNKDFIQKKYLNKSFNNDWTNNQDLGRFPFVWTGRPDHGRTGQFQNKMGLFQEFLLKNHRLQHTTYDSTDLAG